MLPNPSGPLLQVRPTLRLDPNLPRNALTPPAAGFRYAWHRNLEPTFGTQLYRLCSLGLRPVPRRLLYLPGLAGRRGFGRALDIDAALIEPEWRVAVGHQRHINQ